MQLRYACEHTGEEYVRQQAWLSASLPRCPLHPQGGCGLALFEPAAVEALFQATQGMPRKVNRLAHYALTSAAVDKARTVTTEHVQTAREEVGR